MCADLCRKFIMHKTIQEVQFVYVCRIEYRRFITYRLIQEVRYVKADTGSSLRVE